MKASEKFEELTAEADLDSLLAEGDLRLLTDHGALLKIANLGKSPAGDYMVVVTKGDNPPWLYWLDAETLVSAYSNARLAKIKKDRFTVIYGHLPPGRQTLELMADTQVYGVQRTTERLEQAQGWKTEALISRKAYFARIVNIDDPTWVDTFNPPLPE